MLGFKVMERRAVLLCDNEQGGRDRSSERLYVGLSQATDRLIVAGDPDVIWRVGGLDVCRRLGNPDGICGKTECQAPDRFRFRPPKTSTGDWACF